MTPTPPIVIGCGETRISPLLQARRVVIKVGSALLVEAGTGQLNLGWLEALAIDVARLRARDQDSDIE